MNRRRILKGSLLGACSAPLGFRLALADGRRSAGKFLVAVQADGGWDPTSFCDPKENVPGEPVINHWAERDEIREAGNIRYAPFANNRKFFEDHYDKMLVINGVDAQTNSHTTGVVHNWSGRISEGYPTTTALLAAEQAEGLSIGYLSFGGYSQTGGTVRFTRLDSPNLLRNVATPEYNQRGERYFTESEWERMELHRAAEVERILREPGLMPRATRNRQLFESVLGSSEGLSDFANSIPPEDQLEPPEHKPGGTFVSALRRQAQLTVLAFRSGAAVCADLLLGFFDTHATHDADYEWLLGQLTEGVDFLWEYAEQHGVADRMVVVIGSDFGRTNFYNSQDGKDHWPYGSFVIMEKNQPWTNRVVGETDELHFAYNIDPATLERANENDPNGTHIYPKHVHKALRRYLGIENFAAKKGFPFNNTEDFAFFG